MKTVVLIFRYTPFPTCGEIGVIIGFLVVVGLIGMIVQGIQFAMHPSSMLQHVQQADIVWASAMNSSSTSSNGQYTAYKCGDEVCIQPSIGQAYQLTKFQEGRMSNFTETTVLGVYWIPNSENILVLTGGGVTASSLMMVPFSTKRYGLYTTFVNPGVSISGSVAFSPDSRFIAFCGIDGGLSQDWNVYTWDTLHPEKKASFLTTQKSCEQVGWSKDGRYVIFQARTDKALKTYEAAFSG